MRDGETDRMRDGETDRMRDGETDRMRDGGMRLIGCGTGAMIGCGTGAMIGCRTGGGIPHGGVGYPHSTPLLLLASSPWVHRSACYPLLRWCTPRTAVLRGALGSNPRTQDGWRAFCLPVSFFLLRFDSRFCFSFPSESQKKT